MSLEDLQQLISPRFSNNDLLNIVKNYSGLNQITIDNINISPSSQKVGDSYLSVIIRFVLSASGLNENKGTKEKVEVPVITKVIPENVGRKLTFRSEVFFTNEIIFYDKVWATLRTFYKSKNLSEGLDQIVPLLLAFDINGEYICLEDLSFKNFKSVERSNGINNSLANIGLDMFAKFHALSLAFKDQQPENFSKVANALNETYFSKKYHSWYKNLQESLFVLVRDAVRKELPPEYYEKIDYVFNNDLYMKTSEICEKNRGLLTGITQGDAWIPNFLFQEGSMNVVLIDFQLARWAPFTNDVTFFLLSCVEENDLFTHWDEYISTYGSKLKHYLGLLGTSPDIFKMVELKEEIKKNIYFTISMTIEALTMSLLDGFDLDSIITGDEPVPLENVWVIEPFEDQERRKRIAGAIKLIVDKGYI